MHGGYLLFGEGVTVTHSRCASVRYLVIPKPHVSGCVTRPDSSQSMCTSAPGPHLKKATSGEFNGGQIRRTWGRRGSVDAAPGGGRRRQEHCGKASIAQVIVKATGQGRVPVNPGELYISPSWYGKGRKGSKTP